MGRFEEPEPFLLDSYAVIKRIHGAQDEQTLAALQWIIDLYEAWDQPDRAASYGASHPTASATSAAGP